MPRGPPGPWPPAACMRALERRLLPRPARAREPARARARVRAREQARARNESNVRGGKQACGFFADRGAGWAQERARAREAAANAAHELVAETRAALRTPLVRADADSCLRLDR